MLKVINANTKQGKRFINAYLRSTKVTLYDCYVNPSNAKYWAYYDCKRAMNMHNGSNQRIISYNTFTFTFAFRQGTKLIIITQYNMYIIYNALPF